mgnify:CR=1 FL=1
MNWLAVLQACVPILVALVGIIPTVISNRKKTQESLKEMQDQSKKDMDMLKSDVAGLKKDFAQHMKEDEENKAQEARYRILRFYDEVCEGRNHSESHFEDILDDIDFYEQYCETHKEFKNTRGHAAMLHIQKVYMEVKAKGGFLTHKE